jgi:hypothetical protein
MMDEMIAGKSDEKLIKEEILVNEQSKEEDDKKIPGYEWIKQELKDTKENNNFDRLPGLVLEDKKITEIIIDFDKSFESWQDETNKTVKKMIPCTHGGVKKVFWLNCANPIYKELLLLGKAGQKTFKILRTGLQKDTRFTIIKD